MEQVIREIRRRTRVVGAFHDGHSALMLIAARLRHITSTRWGRRRYLLMDTLLNPQKHEAVALARSICPACGRSDCTAASPLCIKTREKKIEDEDGTRPSHRHESAKDPLHYQHGATDVEQDRRQSIG